MEYVSQVPRPLKRRENVKGNIGGAREGAGRPEAEITPEQIEKLAQLGATQLDMARFLNVGHGTIEKRLARPEYRDALERGTGNLHVSLKRKQVEMALAGDRTMLIWLGKNYLGQTDKLGLGGLNGEPLISFNVLDAVLRSAQPESTD